MSKTRFKDIKHFFTVTPDLLEVKGFADGIQGKLELSWQHPMLHTDEDDDQPAEGTNHIRIEVKTEWLPFDPENIPEAKEGYTLLIKYTNNIVDAFTYLDGFWQDIKSVPEKGFTYKLVPLT
jgi:hypothetical protein